MQYAAASEAILGVNKFNRTTLSPHMFVQQDLDCAEVSPVKFLGAASLSKINWHLHHISFPQVQDKPWFNYNKSIERVHHVVFFL